MFANILILSHIQQLCRKCLKICLWIISVNESWFIKNNVGDCVISDAADVSKCVFCGNREKKILIILIFSFAHKLLFLCLYLWINMLCMYHHNLHSCLKYIYLKMKSQFNPFQHTTDLQPMTFKISRELYGRKM